MIKSVAFSGVPEAEKFAKSIRLQSPAGLLLSIERDHYKGITLQDIESEIIQNALRETKAKQIFEGARKGYDKAIELIKSKIKA